MSKIIPQGVPMTEHSFAEMKDNKPPREFTCMWFINDSKNCFLSDQKCNSLLCKKYKNLNDEDANYGEHKNMLVDNTVCIRVKHKTLGSGYIKAVWPDKVVVQFVDRGSKTFIKSVLKNKDIFTFVEKGID